jgi:hypothetical protein
VVPDEGGGHGGRSLNGTTRGGGEFQWCRGGDESRVWWWFVVVGCWPRVVGELESDGSGC